MMASKSQYLTNKTLLPKRYYYSEGEEPKLKKSKMNLNMKNVYFGGACLITGVSCIAAGFEEDAPEYLFFGIIYACCWPVFLPVNVLLIIGYGSRELYNFQKSKRCEG